MVGDARAALRAHLRSDEFALRGKIARRLPIRPPVIATSY
jgi:hypothetical protein